MSTEDPFSTATMSGLAAFMPIHPTSRVYLKVPESHSLDSDLKMSDRGKFPVQSLLLRVCVGRIFSFAWFLVLSETGMKSAAAWPVFSRWYQLLIHSLEGTN